MCRARLRLDRSSVSRAAGLFSFCSSRSQMTAQSQRHFAQTDSKQMNSRQNDTLARFLETSCDYDALSVKTKRGGTNQARRSAHLSAVPMLSTASLKDTRGPTTRLYNSFPSSSSRKILPGGRFRQTNPGRMYRAPPPHRCCPSARHRMRRRQSAARPCRALCT